jgi:tetratricopeptide (TPR) repeat protein/DNA-binding CsgD family transcriptional regulator
MRKHIFIALTYINNILFFSCNQNEASRLLNKASSLADKSPREALQYIDSISLPEKNLNKAEFNKYLVTRTQIYHKNYLSIVDDTLILQAVNYYKQHQENPKEVALAYFYAGTFFRVQKKYDLAIEYFKKAEKFAKKTSDQLTIGLIVYNIGDMLSQQGAYKKALINYEMASKNYDNFPEKKAQCFSSMGRMYLFDHKTDSALILFGEGLKIARNINDRDLERQLTESLSVTYEQLSNFKEALKYLQNSLSLNTDSAKLPRYHLNFALIFDKIYAADSVKFYANKLKLDLKTIKDNYLQASILSFLTEFEKENKNLAVAFDYQSDRMNVLSKIMKDREHQSIYNIERKYNYEQITKQYYKSLAKKQYWIIILMGTVIVGGISFIIYRTQQKSKQAIIQNKIQTLTEMNLDLESMVQKKQSDLRREFLWRFDITKKFIRINTEITKKGKSSTESGLLLKQFNKIVYGQSTIDEQWETLHQAFHQARPGYTEKIKQRHPDLSETEFRIYILTYADFSIKEIALILQQSPNTIQTRRTSLRKKLGVPNGGNIADSIDKLMD